MSKEAEIKVCKNKKCQKVLPAGYKHKYCEACRNKHAETVKKFLKRVGTVAVVSGACIAKYAGKSDSNK